MEIFKRKKQQRLAEISLPVKGPKHSACQVPMQAVVFQKVGFPDGKLSETVSIVLIGIQHS